MTPSPVPQRIPASQAAFLDDVRRVLRVWRTTPLLPVVVLVVATVQLLAGSSTPGVAALAGVLGLLLVGWPGAERLWYLRVWTGRTLTLGEAWRATLKCFGRFFVLALVVGSVGLVLAIPLIVAVVQVADFGDDGSVTFDGLPLWATLYGVGLGVVGYAVLTFVTPAIVYSSRRVRDAVPIGLRLLRVSWPRTVAYVLVPAVLAGAPGLFLGLSPVGGADGCRDAAHHGCAGARPRGGGGLLPAHGPRGRPRRGRAAGADAGLLPGAVGLVSLLTAARSRAGCAGH